MMISNPLLCSGAAELGSNIMEGRSAYVILLILVFSPYQHYSDRSMYIPPLKKFHSIVPDKSCFNFVNAHKYTT